MISKDIICLWKKTSLLCIVRLQHISPMMLSVANGVVRVANYVVLVATANGLVEVPFDGSVDDRVTVQDGNAVRVQDAVDVPVFSFERCLWHNARRYPIPCVLYSAVRHAERGEIALDYPVFIRKYNAPSSLMGSCGFATFPIPPIPHHPCVFPESPAWHRLVNVSQYCDVERQRPDCFARSGPRMQDSTRREPCKYLVDLVYTILAWWARGFQ